jgi:hypothetical protein
MKVKHAIQALLLAFRSRRHEGHTTSMMIGAVNTPNTTVIAASYQQASSLARDFPGPQYLPIDDLQKLTGKRGPILVDHHAIEQVLASAEGIIHDREEKLRHTRDELRALAQSIQSYLNDQA